MPLSQHNQTTENELRLVSSGVRPRQRYLAEATHNWRDSLILPNVTIRDSLAILEKASLRVLLVTDANRLLLGVVSDGDIRRGLIDGVALHAPISTVMNEHPTTAPHGTPTAELVNTMSRLDLLTIPLIHDGHVVGLQSLTEGLAKTHYKNPVFIMAGGGGTRLRPLTNDCPKPLLKVGNRPILERTICHFSKSGFSEFYISTHYIPHMIQEHFGDGKKWGVNIHYVHEDTPLGTAGALGLLPKNLPDIPLIMINGDVLTDINYSQLLDNHIQSSADATICVREYEHQIPYGVIENNNSQMIGMIEKPKYQFQINAGIYVINSNLVASVKLNQRIDMPTLLQNHIAQQKKISVYPIHDYWLDIGSMDDFSRAQIDIKNLNL